MGNLSNDVTEQALQEKFDQIGPVQSVLICREPMTRHSLGYAHVNYVNAEHAELAIQSLNSEPICEKNQLMRVMYSQRDPTARRSGVGNLFISGLHEDITTIQLSDTCGTFGKIKSFKVRLLHVCSSNVFLKHPILNLLFLDFRRQQGKIPWVRIRAIL